MTHVEAQSRRLTALEILAATRISRLSYAPPLYRLLWRCGVEVRPPHFSGFGQNLVTQSCLFGLLFGSFAWSRSFRGMSPATAALSALGYGLFMATYYAVERRWQSLPDWSALSAVDALPR